MSFDINQLWLIVFWMLILQGTGWAVYPACVGLFGRLPDRGYALSKFLGLLTAAWLCWLLASIGPLTPLAEFGHTSAWLCLAVVAGVGCVFFVTNASLVLRQSRDIRKTLLSVEVCFWGLFALMFALRSVFPQVTHFINDSAAEKFTDFSVLNGILCSPTMPPQDAWVSGMPLNYYYFGHFVWAFMIKLTGVLPEVGFNLALCSVAGLIATLMFTVGRAVGGRNRWGFFAVAMVVLCGNADSFFLALGHLLGDSKVTFDFWLPSRAVSNCITEFPAFSLILGDLHAHLLNMPTVLAAMLVGLDFYKTRSYYASIRGYLSNHMSTLFVVLLLIGTASAANSWDVAVICGYFALCIWLSGLPSPDDTNTATKTATAKFETFVTRIPPALACLFGVGLLAMIASSLMFGPFRANFVPPFDHFPIMPNLPENRTALIEFLAHWGLFLLPCAAWLIWKTRQSLTLAGVRSPEFIVCASFAFFLFTLGLTMGSGLTGTLLLCAAFGCIYALLTRDYSPNERLLIGLILLGAVPAFMCEIVHLDDIFSGANERINTIFKLYYGLWPVACVAMLLAMRECPKKIAIGIGAFMLFAGAFYTPLALSARNKMTTRPPQSQIGSPLDGLSYLQNYEPGDLAAIRWIRENVPPTENILEVPGTQYTYAGRISTCTGRPALGGWLYHSWAWRGEARFGAERDRRTTESQTIYCTPDADLARELLLENDIHWVIVGPEERYQYPTIDTAKFTQIGREVFQSHQTAVYRVEP